MLCKLFSARKRGLAAPTAANRRRMHTRSTVSWVPTRRARRPVAGGRTAAAVATGAQARPAGATGSKARETATPALPSAPGMVAGQLGTARGISLFRRPSGSRLLAETAGLVVQQGGQR